MSEIRDELEKNFASADEQSEVLQTVEPEDSLNQIEKSADVLDLVAHGIPLCRRKEYHPMVA